MDVAIIGTGYVGLVTGACLAEAGHHVTCIDNNEAKVDKILCGELPFHEPDLQALVASTHRQGRIRFTTQLEIGTAGAEVILLAIGTPSAANGCADIEGLLSCARHLAQVLDHSCLVVIKSTAPVGTCDQIQAIFDEAVLSRGVSWRIEVASNPEFLAEGRAVEDFRHPERIVIGTRTEQASTLLRRLYAPFDPLNTRMIAIDIPSAEFAKYACNAMLAARVSLINELAGIADQLGADIQSVCRVLKTDSRIGSRYLQPGAGYGGSCLPKDVRALIRMAQDRHEPAAILRSIEQVNQRQVRLLFEAMLTHFDDALQGRRIAVWGLAFKPETDDIREAPSLALIRLLIDAGARVTGYDPVANAAVRRAVPDRRLVLVEEAYQACESSDALVLMTEWAEFAYPDFSRLSTLLGTKAVFDGRNLYRAEDVQAAGLQHFRVGQRGSPRTGSATMASILPGGAGFKRAANTQSALDINSGGERR